MENIGHIGKLYRMTLGKGHTAGQHASSASSDTQICGFKILRAIGCAETRERFTAETNAYACMNGVE